MRTAIATPPEGCLFPTDTGTMASEGVLQKQCRCAAWREWDGSLRPLEGKNRQAMMFSWRASTRGFSRVDLMAVAAVT